LHSGNKVLQFTKKGIYCPQADVYIDPSSSVENAVITHAHSDHARRGSRHYLAHHISIPILKYRLGKNISAEGLDYNKFIEVNGVKLSLHPAGHIPGSAQVRLEYKGEVAVVSGDYKSEYDGLTEAFEPLKCNTFVTESTFALPIYKWKKQEEIFSDMNSWWKQNKEKGIVSVISGYSLGKSQRILYNIDNSIGKIFTHNSIQDINEIMIRQGINLPETLRLNPNITGKDLEGALVITPSLTGSAFPVNSISYSLGFASGWMNVSKARKRSGLDIGFTLSDHADWEGLNEAVKETRAEKIYVTHGFTSAFVRWLREKGYDAFELGIENY